MSTVKTDEMTSGTDEGQITPIADPKEKADAATPEAPASNRRRAIHRLLGHRLGALALVFLIVLYAAALFGPMLLPYNPLTIDLTNALAEPSIDHPFGTDENGRDVLIRVLHGGRVTMLVALASMGIAVSLGAVLGGVGGYLGGWVDRLVIQLIDGMMAVPLFFLWLIVLSSVGPSLLTIVLVIGLTSWMQTARIVRGEVFRVRNLEFIEAAYALGIPRPRIFLRHVLPQAVPAITVSASLATAFAVLSESALSYLGIGIQPPNPSWGSMLNNAQNYIWEAPRLAVYPGILILITVLAFNLLGDALQDAFDPRK